MPESNLLPAEGRKYDPKEEEAPSGQVQEYYGLLSNEHEDLRLCH